MDDCLVNIAGLVMSWRPLMSARFNPAWASGALVGYELVGLDEKSIRYVAGGC